MTKAFVILDKNNLHRFTLNETHANKMLSMAVGTRYIKHNMLVFEVKQDISFETAFYSIYLYVGDFIIDSNQLKYFESEHEKLRS